MRVLLSFLLFFSFGITQALATPADSVVISPFQQKYLNSVLLEPKDWFYLYLASDSKLTEPQATSTWQTFQQIIEQIKAKTERQKSDKKKVEYIAEEIQKTYLVNYDNSASFSALFPSQRYNAYTATALYLVAYNMLGYSCVIKEEPTHSYPIVVLNNTEQLVPSTVPEYFEYTIFDAEYKNSFLNFLKQTQPEYTLPENTNREQAFTQAYFLADFGSYREAATLLFLHDANQLRAQEKYKAAGLQYRLAHEINASARTLFLLRGNALLQLHTAGNNPVQAVNSMLIAKELAPNDAEVNEIISGYFGRLMYELVTEKRSPDLFEQEYRRLITALPADTLSKQLQFTYHSEHARLALQALQSKKALEHAEAAYNLNTNEATTSLFAAVIANRAEQIADPLLAAKHYLAYNDKYPALAKVNTFYNVVLQAYVIQAVNAFEQNQVTDGLALLTTFERRHAEKAADFEEGYILNENLIGRAYSLAAVDFFKRGATTKARQLLERGLTFAPNSYELKQRLTMIK